MRRSRTGRGRGRPARVTVLLLVLVVVAAGARGDRAEVPVTVTVMTRNLYLGGDITAPLRAAAGRTGEDALLAFGHANHALAGTVGRTDFGVRGRLLAAEIVAARPDLVGLQEVATWRHGPLEPAAVGRLDATVVDLDFLATLQAELVRRGTPYVVAAAHTGSDVEGPAFTGPLDTPGDDPRDVRLTVRDVVLVRADAGLTVVGSGGASFRRTLSVPVGEAPYRFGRGYAFVDLEAGGRRLRFVTTQLESQSPALAAAQAGELLLATVARAPGPLILLGDLNSDPADDRPRAGEQVPRSAAYRLVTGRGGLTDAWTASGGAGPGLTGVLGETVDDPTAAGLTRRLDLVLVRPGLLGTVRTSDARLTGADPADRDPATGLWPSDHAGVLVRLTFS